MYYYCMYIIIFDISWFCALERKVEDVKNYSIIAINVSIPLYTKQVLVAKS